MEQKTPGTERPISIHYVYKSDIAYYGTAGDSGCVVSVTGNWKLIHTTIGSIDLKEKPEETPAGTVFRTQLTAQHPGHDNNTPGDIANISGRKVLLKITYRSGREKIIGNAVNQPKLFISSDSNSSTKLTIESNWSSTGPNLFVVTSLDLDSGGIGV
jgi:hypothetical protein